MRVLVIEDEPLIAEVVAGGLTREGLIVDVVGDGDAALSAVAAERHALLVLDLMLPGRDGLEVCREIPRYDGCRLAYGSDMADLGLAFEAAGWIAR